MCFHVEGERSKHQEIGQGSKGIGEGASWTQEDQKEPIINAWRNEQLSDWERVVKFEHKIQKWIDVRIYIYVIFSVLIKYNLCHTHRL